MAATLSNSVFDSGLSYLATNGTRLDLCTTQPTTYTEATSTYTAANKTSLSLSGPADRTGGGRKVTVPAITDGTVTSASTVAWFAITYPGGSELLVTGPLAVSFALDTGYVFTIPSFDIGIPDPA